MPEWPVELRPVAFADGRFTSRVTLEVSQRGLFIRTRGVSWPYLLEAC